MISTDKWKSRLGQITWTDWIETFLPYYRWIRTYKWGEYLQADLIVGITIGVMLVPQSICLMPSLLDYNLFTNIILVLYLHLCMRFWVVAATGYWTYCLDVTAGVGCVGEYC